MIRDFKYAYFGRTYAQNIDIIKITLVPVWSWIKLKKGGRSLYVVIRVSLQRVTKLFNIENNNFIVSKKDLSMDTKWWLNRLWNKKWKLSI